MADEALADHAAERALVNSFGEVFEANAGDVEDDEAERGAVDVERQGATRVAGRRDQRGLGETIGRPQRAARKSQRRETGRERIEGRRIDRLEETIKVAGGADVVITATGAASLTMCVISRSRYSTFTGTTMMPVLMHASQRSMISTRLVR